MSILSEFLTNLNFVKLNEFLQIFIPTKINKLNSEQFSLIFLYINLLQSVAINMNKKLKLNPNTMTTI